MPCQGVVWLAWSVERLGRCHVKDLALESSEDEAEREAIAKE